MLNCKFFTEKVTKRNQKRSFLNPCWILIKKLKKIDLGYCRGKSNFVDNDATENYLAFQPIHRYFKVIANTKYISEWKSKGLSDQSIKPPATYDNSLFALTDYLANIIRLKVNGD